LRLCHYLSLCNRIFPDGGGGNDDDNDDDDDDGLLHTRVHPKVSGPSHKEIYAYNNKRSLKSNTKDYGGKTH
jgi:hypothetical protein